MLFTPPSNKRKNNLTFTQQRKAVKQISYVPSQLKLQANTFQLTLRILDMLIDQNPKICEQLFILKKSITNWYEHNKQESIARIRQIFNLRQNLVIRVKKQIGIVLEQIAYYLRNIVEEYNDSNIEIFYVKYLNAIKKLDWGSAFANQEQQSNLVNAEVQTQNNQSFRPLRTQLSIDSNSQTIDSPHRREKQFNIQKYLDTKQENLDLQRKNDLLKQMLAKQQEQNKKLKLEIDKLTHENDDYKDEQKKYIQEVDKLTKILDKIKEQNDEREQKENLLKMTFGNRQNKFERLGDLKDQLHKQLDNVEQNLEKTNSQSSVQVIREKDDFFANNFRVSQEKQQIPTVKKQPEHHQQDFDEQSEQLDEMYRMLYVQALSVEDEVITAIEISKKRKKEEKRYSYNTIIKSDSL